MEPVHITLLALFGTGLVLILVVLLKPRKDRTYRDTRNLDTTSHLTDGGSTGSGV
ncbi:hypothetical protein [Oceanicola sp. D3]|uniref:hypothetical protein n=1 Tax=Oceanicola sp. D3 TaxID=2587163 RepID=UPI00143D546C|nr:hypothetical protein [Oceanicola sp. D3]